MPPATIPPIAFTPDNKAVLFSADISGQFNIWRVSRSGGTPKQLTSFEDESVRTITVAPDGSTIVFTADPSGDEFHQLYALPIRGGWPERWSDSPRVQHLLSQSCWSPDGSQIAYSANSNVPTDQDVWLRDVETGENRLLLAGIGFTYPAAWSRDGRYLTVREVRGTADSTIHLVDVETGEARELTPHDEDADPTFFMPGPWAGDGSGFYLATNHGREFKGLAFLRLDANDHEWIETPERDIEDLAGSPDGGVLAWLENDDGWSRLRIRDMKTGRDLPAPDLPQGASTFIGSGLAVSPDGSYGAIMWQSPRRPPELYVIETATGTAKRLTDSMIGGLRESDLASPELVSYPSFDGRQIPAWLYKPRRRGRVPVVLSIHGGPQVQERPVYNGFYQYLVSRGIAVLATNIRGSAGYGKTYHTLILRDWGGGRPGGLGARGQVASGRALGRSEANRSLRRFLRRVRLALVCDAAPRLLGRRRGHLRPEQPRHLHEVSAAHVAAIHGEVGGRPGDGIRLPHGALADHIRREHEGPAARDPGRERPARRQGRIRPDGRQAAVARTRGGVRDLRRRGPRLHKARESHPGLATLRRVA
jgi:dipeptidyl aminopeptidase/acylaminoacyl peptidase